MVSPHSAGLTSHPSAGCSSPGPRAPTAPPSAPGCRLPSLGGAQLFCPGHFSKDTPGAQAPAHAAPGPSLAGLRSFTGASAALERPSPPPHPHFPACTWAWWEHSLLLLAEASSCRSSRSTSPPPGGSGTEALPSGDVRSGPASGLCARFRLPTPLALLPSSLQSLQGLSPDSGLPQWAWSAPVPQGELRRLSWGHWHRLPEEPRRHSLGPPPTPRRAAQGPARLSHSQPWCCQWPWPAAASPSPGS